MNNYILTIIAVLLALIIIKKLFSPTIKKKKPSLHPVGYKLIYTDQKMKCKDSVVVSKLLKSEKFGVQGKPDFLYQGFTGKIIPVELKSAKIGKDKFPHLGDMLQLATYFLIVEDIYGVKPKYGNLIYADYMFRIKNTRRIRKEVIKTTKKMRNMLSDGQGSPVTDFTKCRFCFCKSVCEFYARKWFYEIYSK